MGASINRKTEYTVTVDEIKGTYKELTKLKKPIGVHLAQAKCYAYIYAKENELESIRVRMTYCGASINSFLL